MPAYYNENDPRSAAWLRELIAAGHIAPGHVDERSILDVRPHELTGYTQQHFFAGIGGWSYALRLAGWPDERPVRTGSCPCQPFSAAGKGLAEKDERHLWPAFRDLITFGEATVTFGEQVASKLGRQWLSRIRADLEALGYGVGAADLCAASVGAPHIRQRLYWMAYAKNTNRRGEQQSRRAWSGRGRPSGSSGMGDANGAGSQPGRQATEADGYGGSAFADGGAGRLAYAAGWRGAQHGQESRERGREEQNNASERAGPSRLADTNDTGPQGRGRAKLPKCASECIAGASGDVGRLGNAESEQERLSRFAWGQSDSIPCQDGKSRRIESGSFPLAHGVSGRVGLLRGYGNAIVPQVAAQFIQAAIEAIT